MDGLPSRCFLGLRWKPKTDVAWGPFSDAVFRVLLFSLPALGLILAGLLPPEEVHAETGHGLSLLASLGSMGCAGHLANYLLRHRQTLLAACSMLAALLSVAVFLDSAASGQRGRRPAPVISMLSSFFVLFSGLGGWVDVRTLLRGSNLTAPNLTV